MLSTYEQLTYKESTQIIYYQFIDSSKHVVLALIEELMMSNGEPHKHIAPNWYEAYKQHLADNKKERL